MALRHPAPRWFTCSQSQSRRRMHTSPNLFIRPCPTCLHQTSSKPNPYNLRVLSLVLSPLPQIWRRRLASSPPRRRLTHQSSRRLNPQKDRLYVLKLAESMEELIRERPLGSRIDLRPASSYQRLLVHRCAGYYNLQQEPLPHTIGVITTQESRM
jgi:hypothetical protein